MVPFALLRVTAGNRSAGPVVRSQGRVDAEVELLLDQLPDGLACALRRPEAHGGEGGPDGLGKSLVVAALLVVTAGA